MRQHRARPDNSGAAAATAAPPAPSSLRRPPWRKVLWARQEGYDDAHTSEDFLAELVVNATVPQRDYGTVVWSSLVVDQQLATVAAVGAASHHVYKVRRRRWGEALFGKMRHLPVAPWGCKDGSWPLARARHLSPYALSHRRQYLEPGLFYFPVPLPISPGQCHSGAVRSSPAVAHNFTPAPTMQGSITPRQLLLADALLMLLGSLLYLGSALWSASKAATSGQAGAWLGDHQHRVPSSPARMRQSPAKAAPLADVGGRGSPSKQQHRHGPQRHQQPDPPDPAGLPLGLPAAAGWWPRIADGASSLAALAAATALLSPLLGTLTETVSSDSIIACACLLLLAHLYLHDYHFSAGLTSQLSGSLALGCAVCGSVLVASRLGSPQGVYAQVGQAGEAPRPCSSGRPRLLSTVAACITHTSMCATASA